MIVQKVADWPGERALYEQLYEGLSVSMPELEQRRWREPSGLLAGWVDGTLAGFVVFFAVDGPEPGKTAHVQWILAQRERVRIESGFNAEYPARAEEIEVLTTLISAAADSAREAGYQVLRWSDAEVDIAERLAERIGVHASDGRYQLTL